MPTTTRARRLGRLALLAILLAGPVDAQAADPNLLPAAPAYARNPGCAPARIALPPATHALPGGVAISPRPADIPVGQGDSAICFAYATADMISQRVGRAISPLDVATKFYFADPARLATLRDGRIAAHLRAHPHYLADIAWSRNAVDIAKEHNPGLEPYFDRLEGGEEDAAALLYNLDGLCDERDLPSHEGYAHFTRFFLAARYGAVVRAPRMCFRSTGATVDKLRSRRADAVNDAWLREVARRCRRRPSPVPLLPVSYRVAANQLEFMDLLEAGTPPGRAQLDRMLAMVDYALDHGRAPTIGYSWYILEERDPKDPDLAADHSSTVIARRKVGGRCQYRVQDNTGEYCARMRPGIRERCDNGRIWLTEAELRATLYSVIYLR
ncbi:hypothetical protein [Methylobacterium symbioticum]|uniref:Peptidase C1A papain C-terminal domain-containing protein n=1 Tax=Methylobacterium symbioticum TaxID=2584084 RepID=A0A509E8U5_9HYPH|nr:hypothetical protein [Methylobacterium symbioticum]VUD70590.1 hypothetical protein MET9862_01160 [Methylobacterium symbioticum]